MDLIFGFAGLTTQQWRYNLDKNHTPGPHLNMKSIDEGTTAGGISSVMVKRAICADGRFAQ